MHQLPLAESKACIPARNSELWTLFSPASKCVTQTFAYKMTSVKRALLAEDISNSKRIRSNASSNRFMHSFVSITGRASSLFRDSCVLPPICRPAVSSCAERLQIPSTFTHFSPFLEAMISDLETQYPRAREDLSNHFSSLNRRAGQPVAASRAVEFERDYEDLVKGITLMHSDPKVTADQWKRRVLYVSRQVLSFLI